MWRVSSVKNQKKCKNRHWAQKFICKDLKKNRSNYKKNNKKKCSTNKIKGDVKQKYNTMNNNNNNNKHHQKIN